MTWQALKDPDAVLDYRIDWTLVLNNSDPVDTIADSTWVVDAGLVIDSDTYQGVLTTAWVSGGTLKDLGKLVNTIITTGGRTHVRTIEVSIIDT